MNNNLYNSVGKRLFDVIVSLLSLIVLSPVFVGVAFFVRFKLGSPILFVQERPGKDEEIFRMYKFRTMKDDRDEQVNLLSDDKRLTPFGKLLRSTSLDELPELINILKGDMSLVGPRPLLKEYLTLYNDEQKQRHLVRPGLTGLAQVSGRNAISWKEKFSYDVKYVKSLSFLLDIKILLLTIKKVIVKDGINSDDSVTMEPFKGNKS
jgi:lipopolysaccharide/colanic/teichoic acid biosynthesis glycosyltransferase